ncbi:LysM peptidoglycan-binding domain-containing protein, partial [Sphingomonas sp. Leaf33]|uniref:LysM peptidoglycan-binding domain-containing protein n=1 Tax=Sphingomonas sp. Leaf33 TaxID=1736215 RepID=UPI000A854130
GGWHQSTHYANGFERVEQSDVFGRTTYSHDRMPDVTMYTTHLTYDRGGRMVARSGNEGETVTYNWYNTGLLSAQSSDLGLGYERAVSRYGYDAAGRKTAESFWRDGAQYTQSNAAYDALGRMTWWHQAETALPWATMTWAYDAVGNIRRTTADKATLDQWGNAVGRAGEDRWFLYDAMNRVTLDGGQLSNGQIVRGWNGASLVYDRAGQRVSSTRDASLMGQVWIFEPYQKPGDPYYLHDPDRGEWVQHQAYYTGLRQESFGYAADGQLTNVAIVETGYTDDGQGNAVSTNVLDRQGGGASFQFDGMGRQTRQLDYDAAGQIAYDHEQVYSAAGRVTRDITRRLEGGVTLVTDTSNDYGGHAALGQVVSSTTHSHRDGQPQGTTYTSNGYNWRSGGPQIASTSTSGQTSSSTVYTYGAGGRLETISISDGRSRTISIVSDLTGQALTRDESDTNPNVGDPHERWYRFNGNELGHVGNDGTGMNDYAGSVQTRGWVQQNGAFGNNRRYGHAFSESIDQITSYEQGSSGGGYTVRAGDTLAGIAAQVWGDASLWYKLAQANGLGANAALTTGQTLTLPAGVIRSTYNAS